MKAGLMCLLLFMYGAEQSKKSAVKKQFSLELQCELPDDSAMPTKEQIQPTLDQSKEIQEKENKEWKKAYEEWRIRPQATDWY